MAGSISTPNNTPLALYQSLFANRNNNSGYDDFYSNPKGFFQDVNKVGQYNTSLKDYAVANPEAYRASYDQFLKGTPTTPGNNPSLYTQYENDPGYYRPFQSPSSGWWYDYNNNEFKDYGQGFGTPGFTPTEPTTPDAPLPETASANKNKTGYTYESKNPYLDNLKQVGQSKNNTPYLKQLMGL